MKYSFFVEQDTHEEKYLEQQKKVLECVKSSIDPRGNNSYIISWFYYYLKNFFDYYNSCRVKDRSIAHIKISIQEKDNGDEWFDFFYEVCEKIYGKENKSWYETTHDCKYGNDTSVRNPFTCLGGEDNTLVIEWTIYLDRVKL